MTYQTTEPVREIAMAISGRAWGGLIHHMNEGDISYDVPYQRGDVWTYAQRIMLIHSILSGTPIPALIINDRPQSMWFGPDGERRPIYAVIDGKQRITAVQMFMAGELPVPVSWFPIQYVLNTEPTDDGPYVRYPGLPRPAQRFFENIPVPVAEAHVKTVREEAAIYLRVNGTGTPQSDEDIMRAAGIAEQGE